MMTSAVSPIVRQVEHLLAPLLPATSSPVIAVALSGGLDSSVLLHLLSQLQSSLSFRLHVLHVHHGLSPHADVWLGHCQAQAQALDLPFDARRVTLSAVADVGIEDAARTARYRALGDMCTAHGAAMLVTAHHQDDQMETVLLHLLRGAGVTGLSGMAMVDRMPSLLGTDLPVVRPLLATSRSMLESYASAYAIRHVEDESNSDVRYTRNAIRQSLAPVLEQFFPGYQGRVQRAAEHARSATRLLTILAEQDVQACAADGGLDVQRLAALGDERADNLLYYWLTSQGWRVPSQAWQAELREQLLTAAHDAQPCVDHPLGQVRRHAGVIRLVPGHPYTVPAGDVQVQWQGEARIHVPQWRGSLVFVPAEEGIAAVTLREQPLVLRARSGGERLRVHPRQPVRKLKVHYQMQDVPTWERPYLPVVYCAGQLLFAAGAGMDCQFATTGDKLGHVVLQWEPDGVTL